jgi:hypothetical protein
VQSPQCAESVFVSTQRLPPVPAHTVKGASHAQCDIMHAVPAGQALPHAPQLLRSLPRSTHVPPQGVVPTLHAHIPAMQPWPTAHVCPQLPQFV